MRKVRDSARAFALKLIWRLFTQHTSLWVNWVKHYLLKYNSFLDVRDESEESWICRKLLNLREVAYQFLKIEVKDGRNCHFWFDDWAGQGRLIDTTGAAGTILLGVQRHAKVCDAVTMDGWRIKGQRGRRSHDLYNSIMAIEPPRPEDGSDIILWRHSEDDYKVVFSAKQTWEPIRPRRSKVVWFLQGVPRFSFILWLAINNKLSTGDRMRQWGITQGCELCGERDETRDHLFFTCPYSYTIWERLARRLVGSDINPDWQWTVQQLQRMGGRGVDPCLARLLFQTIV